MAGELELKWVGKIISLKYEQIFLLHLSLSLSSLLSHAPHTPKLMHKRTLSHPEVSGMNFLGVFKTTLHQLVQISKTELQKDQKRKRELERKKEERDLKAER